MRMPPVVGRGLFFLSILSIADGGELTCKLYFLLFEGVRWFWGLTCDFWAEFEENIFGCRGKATGESHFLWQIQTQSPRIFIESAHRNLFRAAVFISVVLPVTFSSAHRILLCACKFFRGDGGRDVGFRSMAQGVMRNQLGSGHCTRQVDFLEILTAFG